MKFVAKWLILSAFVLAAEAQVMTGRLEGTVTDTQGASIPACQVKVVNGQTAQNFSLVTDEKGGMSKVTIKDVNQSNGVIHVIDTVLLPA